VEWARRAYPGIEGRRCSLEKTFGIVEDRTKEALRQVRGDADVLVDRIMNGTRMLNKSDSLDPDEIMEDLEDWVGLVPADLCRRAHG
jgi:hypothetical protein